MVQGENCRRGGWPPCSFEDHDKEFRFESVNKGKPHEGFSWKVVGPMTIWQRTGKELVRREQYKEWADRRRILCGPGLDLGVAEEMERNKLTQVGTDSPW